VDGFGRAGSAQAEVGGRVRGGRDTGASRVEVVGGVADGADSGDIGGGGAAAEDGLVGVLPEPGLELECDFAYLAVRVHVDCGPLEGGEVRQTADSRILKRRRSW
jgi:hypothetical protein